MMLKTREITSKASGKVYEVRKMRTEDSFFLPVYHYRRVGDTAWKSLHTDTLAESRKALGA